MSTPNRRLSGASLQGLAPSGSYLQQLLQEIERSGHPTTISGQTTPQNTPRKPNGSSKRRHSESVWVGGTSIARDARKKLRAADEARFGQNSLSGNDGTPEDTPRPRLHLHIPHFDAPTQALSRESPVFTPGDPCTSPSARLDNNTQESGYMNRREADSPRPRRRPSAGLLNLPATTTHRAQSSLGYNQATGLPSPLFLVDEESASSTTTSPSEDPISAISNTLTDATTVSSGPPADYSPRERTHSLHEVPQMLSRERRTMTMPDAPDRVMSRSNSSRPPWRRSIGGDNRSIIRSSTFTERTIPSPEHTSNDLSDILPDLSSFRPQASDAQGIPRATVPSSRSVTRRTSVVERDNTPELDDTPSYARSFHLVDTEDASIYQKTHGDEWRSNPLCLYCFRKHGNFSKLEEYGYEACGRDEALESHYWQ